MVIGFIFGYFLVELEYVVVWVDVYVDINIFLMFLFGNMYGMFLLFLVKEFQLYISKFFGFEFIKLW